MLSDSVRKEPYDQATECDDFSTASCSAKHTIVFIRDNYMNAGLKFLPPRKILAVASGGGHWVQLLRLRPAFKGHRVAYVSVNADSAEDVADETFHVVRDATRWNKLGLIVVVFQLLIILLRERPHIVVSTGAAPGFLALRLGKLLGARTIWIDSVANVEFLSLSGLRIGPHADLWLTQWPHLARPEGPHYIGAVT